MCWQIYVDHLCEKIPYFTEGTPECSERPTEVIVPKVPVCSEMKEKIKQKRETSRLNFSARLIVV